MQIFQQNFLVLNEVFCVGGFVVFLFYLLESKVGMAMFCQ